MKILESNPVPVVPMALQNLWGSFFSRVEDGQAMVRPFRRGLFSRVGPGVGAPIGAAQVTPGQLQRRVGELLDLPRCRAHSRWRPDQMRPEHRSARRVQAPIGVNNMDDAVNSALQTALRSRTTASPELHCC